MKHLTDTDIETMTASEFVPDARRIRDSVRRQLQLSHRVPSPEPTPTRPRIDLHGLTEEQAWAAIVNLIESGARHAVVITGASGILKIKFQQWARDSLISQRISSIRPLNNGSFDVVITRPPMR